MNFSISYSELSKIISSAKCREIRILSEGRNSFSMHTKQGVLITSVDIDWYFTYRSISNNKIYMNVKTSGWFSDQGINSVLGSKDGISLENELMTIDVSKLLPKNLKYIKVTRLMVTNIGLDFELRT